MIFPTLTVVALASLVSAQSNGLAAIEAHFKGSLVVPELIAAFTPTSELAVSFAGAVATPGQRLEKDAVQVAPALKLSGNNVATGTYTIIMADADVVGNKEQASFPTRHWLVNSMKSTADGSLSDNSSAVAVTTFAGPGPAEGSGAHRYTILIYEQPASFAAPEAFSQPNIGVSTFSLTDYVSGSGLGPLVAGFYFNVEVGTATASPVATQSVDSATLEGASVGGSSGGASNTASKPAATGSNPTSAGAPAGSAAAGSDASRVIASVATIVFAAAGVALLA